MPVRPEDIQSKKFKVVRGIGKGYDEVEVDTFLDDVEVELSRLVDENEALRQRLDAALNAPPPQPVASEAEEMLRRTLLLAQRTADETVAQAQAEAERLTNDARQTSHALVESARAQAAAATSELERRRQALEQHIDGLRAFEREYRTRLKAYLESQLRDLEGRGAPAVDAPGASGVPSVPPVPPVPQVPPVPAVPMAVPHVPDAVPDAGPDAAPDAVADPVTDAEPAAETSVEGGSEESYEGAFADAYGEAEPFDLDGGGTDVPKLAP